MFKRLLSIGVIAVTAISAGATSAAASAKIEGAFHGAFAEAAWQSSETSFGFMLVSREQDGTTHLSIHQFTEATFDADGNVTSGNVIKGETTSGVTFTIDTVHYTSAGARGVVPVMRCRIVDGAETACVDAGSATVAARWEGVGPIPHSPGTELSWQEGCLLVDRSSSIEREAVATVTAAVDGDPISTSPITFAGFGKGNSRLIFACPSG